MGKANCNQEQRQVNNNTGVAITGPVGVPQKIFTNPGGQTEIIEISLQPDNDCDLQLFEGLGTGLPLTAVRHVLQYLLWSTPGKSTQSDLYVVIGQPTIHVQIDVRYRKT